MSQELWTSVDRYVTELVVRDDPVLDSVLRRSHEAGLPAIHVSPNQGKLLMLLAKMQGARRILEIGTLGAYSTLWLARALPRGGRLVTLESHPKHAEVARANIAEAGLQEIVELRLGAAVCALAELASEGCEPFDFVFIDADKQSTPQYFASALNLCRSGSVIVVDNVIREGEIINLTSDDASVQAMRQFHALVAAEKRVSATTIQTVGSKGYDGFTIALVN